MRRVGLCTLGCKVAQYETEAMTEAFVRNGFAVGNFEEKCDVYVINTCTVTAESDRKSRQMIRRAVRQNPDALVMVTGCYAQTSPEKIASIDGVSYVIGSEGKMRIPQKALELTARQSSCIIDLLPLANSGFEPMTVQGAPRTRAYVKIEDGCECRCTYCAIPGARGHVRSKAPGDVINEVNGLARGGVLEVVLTGIETASYGVDLDGYRLADLLEDLEVKSDISRIRLGSLTPELMKPDFVERIRHLTKLVPHFHLSMQSGADAVLRNMKRRYNAEQALSALSRLRDAIPGAQFTTDKMV
ncbi:MAG: MiaB/RimO family radical SAM methylthiotransferase [Clostridia bacterium]|nr:MiaB/RimO family radical SAM methylthiotransferase [Clostridia bacterium]